MSGTWQNACMRAVAAAAAKDWRRPHWRILYCHDVPTERAGLFAAQLDWFSERFAWCSISAGVDALRRGCLEHPMVSLTFDDGDLAVHDVVMPLLAERRICACAYIVPTYVDRGQSYRDRTRRPVMSWDAVREWLAAGNEVGSHTYTHAPMNRCSPQRARQEAEWSQSVLEDRLQVPVRHFAYPWGQCNSWTRDLMRQGGWYDSVATILRGPMDAGHDLFALRRDRCELSMDMRDLETAMRLADRLYWLRHLRHFRSSRPPVGQLAESWDPLPPRDR